MRWRVFLETARIGLRGFGFQVPLAIASARFLEIGRNVELKARAFGLYCIVAPVIRYKHQRIDQQHNDRRLLICGNIPPDGNWDRRHTVLMIGT